MCAVLAVFTLALLTVEVLSERNYKKAILSSRLEGYADVVAAALAVDKVKKATGGMQIVKTILVKNRLVNLIVKPQ